MNNLHVAIVEDDEDDREFISSALLIASHKLKISSFSSGVDFMNALSSRICIPDLIVTDIRMPLMTGFEVIYNVKKEGTTKEIPIVVLSTSGNEEDIARARDLGAEAYYIKPYSLPEYCDITTRIISSLNFDLINDLKTFVHKIRASLRMSVSLVPESAVR